MSAPGRVLLVAPDLIVAGRAGAALEAAGFTVERRSPRLEEPPADGEPPAYLVVDLDGRGFDALELAGRARARWPGARIVGIVQHVRRDRIAAARAAGFHRIVPRSRLAELGAALAAPAG